MQLHTFLFAASAAAFAPTPNQRIDTRLHFNFGNFGGKKVDEEAAVKLVETVDDVGALAVPADPNGARRSARGRRRRWSGRRSDDADCGHFLLVGHHVSPRSRHAARTSA